MHTLGIILSKRSNANDKISLIDISQQAITSHTEQIQKFDDKEKYTIKQGDMNKLELEDDSVDIIVNDYAINFNTSHDQNKKTLSEINRVLKATNSICLISTVVPKCFNDNKYGQDQELIPANLIDTPVDFYPLTFASPSTEISRKCWSLPYYKSLFRDSGFNFHEFDILRGKNYFPEKSQISFRRFVLTKV